MRKNLTDLCDEAAVKSTEQTQDVESVLSQYRGKSEAELFDTLRSMTKEEQENGNLDDCKMDEIYQKLSPMLTPAQREKMQQVISRLKE